MSALNDLANSIEASMDESPGFIAWTGQGPMDLAVALTAAGYSKPRAITTVAELEALPGGSIIRDDLGFAWQKYNKPISDKPAWFAATRDTGFYFSSNFIDGNRAPLTVLWEPAP